MCGICFMCTLSGKSLAAHVHTSFSLQDSSSVKTSGLLDSSSELLVNGVGQQALATWSQKEEEMVDALFTDPLLHHRGPDVTTKHTFPLSEGLNGFMLGCVLHLRGQITPQPVKDPKGNALMWNGEIFDGIQVEEHENDTQVLFSHLVSSLTERDLLKTMQKICGPWSFIFWQADTQKLWFGRDMFGRRSLLWHLPASNNDQLVLSSVALGEMAYTEVPSVGIFSLDLSKSSISSPNSSCPLLTLYPWKNCFWPGTSVPVVGTNNSDVLGYLYPKLSSCLSVYIDAVVILDSWIPDVNRHLPETDDCLEFSGLDEENSACLEDMLMRVLKDRSDLDSLAEELVNVLQKSVDKRVNNLPREYCRCQNCLGPLGDNNCLRPLNDNNCQNCILALGVDKLNINGSSAVRELQESYSSSLEGGISKLQLSCCGGKNGTSRTNVAVLFSGGLDSTILAALADRCVPEGETIDLLNVAFEQPVLKSVNNKQPKGNQKARKKSKKTAASEPGGSKSNNSDLKNMHGDSCGAGESHLDKYISHGPPEPCVLLLGECLNGSIATDQSIDILKHLSMQDHSYASKRSSNSPVLSDDTMPDPSSVFKRVSNSPVLSDDTMPDPSSVFKRSRNSPVLSDDTMPDPSSVFKRVSTSPVLSDDITQDHSSVFKRVSNSPVLSDNITQDHSYASKKASTSPVLSDNIMTNHSSVFKSANTSPVLSDDIVPGHSSVFKSANTSPVLSDDIVTDHSSVFKRVSPVLSDDIVTDHSSVFKSANTSPVLSNDIVPDHSTVSNKDSNSSVLSDGTLSYTDHNTPSGNFCGSFDVPDRQTGVIALSELNPNRKWNFVEINVTQAELQALRKSHIRRLIYPSQTVLDDSIGCAVWFAARGSGVLPHEKGQKFVSKARVILCGMAADEQFGGYSRHRVTFKTKGWEGLLKEIQEEMWRISARNLGRDDRTITDHGKECRFPFLDETFTHFVSSIPVHKRADLRLPRGVGDKLLLRLCALKLGLVKTAAQPKRAIQFGSKIAKLDKRKEKGSDICDRLG